jgi:hypothetical protein
LGLAGTVMERPNTATKQPNFRGVTQRMMFKGSAETILGQGRHAGDPFMGILASDVADDNQRE